MVDITHQIHKNQSTIKGKFLQQIKKFPQTYFRKALWEQLCCCKETFTKRYNFVTKSFSNRHAALGQKYRLNCELTSEAKS